MMELEPAFLRGSYPPLVTPLRGGAVDEDAFARLVERQCSEGSQGVVVAGTTGEPSTLTADERVRLVRVAVESARGRLAVVAATGSQSHAETVWLTDQSARCGADALLVVTPYFIRPPQRGLAAYFVDLGQRTSLPLMIYHIPSRAAVSLEVETLAAIAAQTPTLVGIKHASSDIGYVTAALKSMGPEFRIFAGLEELSFPMLAVGAAGLMNAVGNIDPRRVAQLWRAASSGDMALARQIHESLFELSQAAFFDTNPIPVKYMMKRLGLLETNDHRLPMLPATPEMEERLDAVLERSGLIPVAA